MERQRRIRSSGGAPTAGSGRCRLSGQKLALHEPGTRATARTTPKRSLFYLCGQLLDSQRLFSEDRQCRGQRSRDGGTDSGLRRGRGRSRTTSARRCRSLARPAVAADVSGSRRRGRTGGTGQTRRVRVAALGRQTERPGSAGPPRGRRRRTSRHDHERSQGETAVAGTRGHACAQVSRNGRKSLHHRRQQPATPEPVRSLSSRDGSDPQAAHGCAFAPHEAQVRADGGDGPDDLFG